jgi:peptidoglycan/LPS O-acetylase OafA/YrhL
MQYRREIDGLRAIAVIPVILFHAGFQTFGGGFIGVDVFFVISGYLITSIILAERAAGTFSLAKFWERRARRILPALYAVILFCIPTAWLLMLPDDLENFGQSMVATTLFSNNVLLWLTSGYFGLANEFKPLLHTWSLGVEEQFYLLFPLILLLSWRLGPRWPVSVATTLLFASLAAAQWAPDPIAKFFLLPTRAWELLIGVLLALSGWQDFNLPVRQAGSCLGLLLLVYAALAFDQTTPFPGIHALVPVSGTALIILFAMPDTWVGKLLASKILVGIGLISYSLYLWHQPLLSFLRISSLDEPSVYQITLAIAATFLLAMISWRFVERPFRNKQAISTGNVIAISVGLGLCISVTGWQIHAKSGFVEQWPELDVGDDGSFGRANALYNERVYQYSDAEFTNAANRKVLVIGNSFARDFINAAWENNYLSSSEIAYSAQWESCMENAQTVNPRLRSLIPRADYVIFGSPPPLEVLPCWDRDLKIYKSLGAKNIIVIGTKNFGWNLNSVMRLPAPDKYSYRVRVLDNVLQEHEAVAQAISSEYFVDLLGLLADADGRVPVFTPDHKLISQDTMHLTKAGAKFVGQILFEHPLLTRLK